MAVFTWVVLGLLIAGNAKLVAWDNTPLGWFPVMLAGAAGAVLGGFISRMFGIDAAAPGFELRTLLLAVVSAGLVLWLYYAAIGKRRIATAREAGSYRRAA